MLPGRHRGRRGAPRRRARRRRAFWLAAAAGLARGRRLRARRSGGGALHARPTSSCSARSSLCALGYARGRPPVARPRRRPHDLLGARPQPAGDDAPSPSPPLAAHGAARRGHRLARVRLRVGDLDVPGVLRLVRRPGPRRRREDRPGPARPAGARRCCWAALVLGEHVGAATLVAALVVLACVVATQRTRVGSRPGCLGRDAARRQDLSAHALRRGPREDQGVRARGRRDQPAAPRPRGGARRRLRGRRRAADVRGRLLLARDRARSTSTPRSGSTSRCSSTAARSSSGGRWSSPATRSRRPSRVTSVERARAATASSSSSRCPPTRTGDTVCVGTWTNIVRGEA